jgi:hypothetical protein
MLLARPLLLSRNLLLARNLVLTRLCPVFCYFDITADWKELDQKKYQNPRSYQNPRPSGLGVQKYSCNG